MNLREIEDDMRKLKKKKIIEHDKDLKIVDKSGHYSFCVGLYIFYDELLT